MLINADKVRAMRLEKGWTQDQFAELCDLSVRTIQRIEKTGVASLDTSNALAAVLEAERTSLLAQGGVQAARSEFTLKHVVLTGGAMLAVGIGVGVAFF